MAVRIVVLALAAWSLGASSEPAVHHYGRGGKFKIFDKTERQLTSLVGLTAYVDSVKEIDETGQVIRTIGHALQTLANTYFQAVAPTSGATVGTAQVDEHKSTASVTGLGKVHSDSFLVTRQGNVGNSHDPWRVSPGDVQWTVGLSEWSFCQPCFPGDGSNESAAHVDLVLGVHGVAKYARILEEDGIPVGVDLDDGAALRLSRSVEVDGLFVEMPEGYPQAAISNGNNVYLTLRIPKFATEARYHALITGAAGAARSASKRSEDGGARLERAAAPASRNSKWAPLPWLASLLFRRGAWGGDEVHQMPLPPREAFGKSRWHFGALRSDAGPQALILADGVFV